VEEHVERVRHGSGGHDVAGVDEEDLVGPRDAVASSSMSSSGPLSTVRMKAMSCFCPRLMVAPLAATFVCSPSSKRASRRSRFRSAKRLNSCSSEWRRYRSLPYRMLSRIVPVKSSGSCRMKPIFRLRSSGEHERMSRPSSRTRPAVGS
jgi:hypothetical protein